LKLIFSKNSSLLQFVYLLNGHENEEKTFISFQKRKCKYICSSIKKKLLLFFSKLQVGFHLNFFLTALFCSRKFSIFLLFPSPLAQAVYFLWSRRFPWNTLQQNHLHKIKIRHAVWTLSYITVIYGHLISLSYRSSCNSIPRFLLQFHRTLYYMTTFKTIVYKKKIQANFLIQKKIKCPHIRFKKARLSLILVNLLCFV